MIKRAVCIFITLLCFLSAESTLNYALDITTPTAVQNLSHQTNNTDEIIKGTVVHIFEDFTNNQDVPQKIAKVKLSGSAGNKDLTLIDLPDTVSLNQGDQILISKLENSETFGMGDSFENKFSFVDFARDSPLFFLTATLLLALFLINKKSLFTAAVVAANIFLLIIILPVFLYYHVHPFFFIIIFIGANSYLFKELLSSRYYYTALGATLTASLLTLLVYLKFIDIAKLNEYYFFHKILPYSTLYNFSSVDSVGFIASTFFIYLYTTLFFVKISYTNNIYDNFKIIFFRLTLLYFSLALGLLLPAIIFFNYNGLDMFYLANFFPFSSLFTKFLFIFWGNIICCLLYLISFYIQNKKHFQKHIVTPATVTTPKILDLAHILKDRRVAKYHAGSSWKKKQSKTKKHKK